MRFVVLVSLLTFVAAPVFAQHAFTPDEIAEGSRLFQTNCTGCHGSSGDLVQGVALMSGKFRRASTDDEVATIIRKGVPGTAMQGFSFTEQQAGMIVAYFRSFTAEPAATPADMPALGDPARGKAILEGKGNCLSCHRVGENGSRVGPDLTGIGAPRPPVGRVPAPPPTPAVIVQQLQRSIVDPDADISPANRTFKAVLKDGSTVTGRLLNFDSFNVQVFDSKERLLSIPRSDLREFSLTKSPMPSYRNKLNNQELSDLLAYLVTLKGQVK